MKKKSWNMKKLFKFLVVFFHGKNHQCFLTLKMVSVFLVFSRKNTFRCFFVKTPQKNTDHFECQKTLRFFHMSVNNPSLFFTFCLLCFFFLGREQSICGQKFCFMKDRQSQWISLNLRKLQFESNQWDENENREWKFCVKSGSKFIKKIHHSYENTGKTFISEIMHRQSNRSVQIF